MFPFWKRRDGSFCFLFLFKMVYFYRVMKMPRQARKKSLSNIYHVMLRGINRQLIFENDGDRRQFMLILTECKEVSGFRLHAFCLMPNHIHLLIEPAEESLEVIFKRIGSRYATWYNRKHQRVGHLFQDRFRSENVETDQYYMTVLRYILQNPMKAGMESRPGTYRWSSYLAYDKGTGSVTDTEYAENMFGSREALIRFVQQNSDETALDDTDFDWRIRDDQAQKIMERITQCPDSAAFLELDKKARRVYIRELYMEKLSLGQIANVTGVPRSTVYKAVKGIEPQLLAERMKFKEEKTDFEVSDEIIW